MGKPGEASAVIWKELKQLKDAPIPEEELQKLKKRWKAPLFFRVERT